MEINGLVAPTTSVPVVIETKGGMREKVMRAQITWLPGPCIRHTHLFSISHSFSQQGGWMGHLHCRRPGRNAAKDALGVSSSGVHRGQCHTGEAGSHQAGSFHPTGTCPGRSHRALQSSTFHMADSRAERQAASSGPPQKAR